MEDLWKLTCIDYRISAIAEHRDYEEIVRRYHAEEADSENKPLLSNADHTKTLNKE